MGWYYVVVVVMVEGKVEGVVERCQAAPLRPAGQCGFVSDPYLRVSYIGITQRPLRTRLKLDRNG